MLYNFYDDTDTLIGVYNIGENPPNSYIGTSYNNLIVNRVDKYITLVEEDRRQERQLMFSNTIDKMNPIWYNSLTSDQQKRLDTWRTQWLNYPDGGIKPTADVSDIFKKEK